MVNVIQRWLDDDPNPYQQKYSDVDMLHLAIDHGTMDVRKVANAIALTEYAVKIYEANGRLIPFDSIAEFLLAGVQVDHEPYWWYRRVWNRFLLFLRFRKD